MIPTDRPVNGDDLRALKGDHALTDREMLWLLGMEPPDWYATIKATRPRPMKDAARAVMVRLLAEHPELMLIPQQPNPRYIFECVRDAHGPTITMKRFGLAFGRMGNAARRWIVDGQYPDPSTERLMTMWMMAWRNDGISIFLAIERLAHTEATARGIPDLHRQGTWQAPMPAETRQRRSRALTKRKSCFNRRRPKAAVIGEHTMVPAPLAAD